MSGKARRASNQRFWEMWKHHLWFMDEIGYHYKFDWIRGQEISLDYMHDEETWKKKKFDFYQFKLHIQEHYFPQHSRFVFCDPMTGEPINAKEQAKYDRYKQNPRYKR